jgi:hypothetical protein
MITLSRLGLVAVAVAAGVTVLAVGPAKADVFQLTSDHCTGGCLGDLTSGGTVTVTQAGTNTLDFSVALASGFTIINTGFDGSFAFDLNPNQTITYSNLTAGFSPVGGNPVGAQNLSQFDGFASFEYAVLRDVQGGGDGLPDLSFTITGSNLTLGSLEQNSSGAFFVVDVRGANGNTGLIDASSGSTDVPEPASIAIFGTALAGLGLFYRRQRKNV